MRIAVIGSSHVAAIKDAAPDIAAAYPHVALTFFALPGGVFRRARLRNGTFAAANLDPAESAFIQKINGATSLDVGGFDHLWVVGDRFGLGQVLALRQTAPEDQIDLIVTESVSRLQSQFGTQNNLVFSPAPYPALAATQAGPKHEMRLARMLRNPDGSKILSRFESAIASQLAATGYTAVLQPATTRAAVFATEDKFLQNAPTLAAGQQPDRDLRHMNAAYGHLLFDAFAARHLI